MSFNPQIKVREGKYEFGRTGITRKKKDTMVKEGKTRKGRVKEKKMRT